MKINAGVERPLDPADWNLLEPELAPRQQKKLSHQRRFDSVLAVFLLSIHCTFKLVNGPSPGYCMFYQYCFDGLYKSKHGLAGNTWEPA